VSSSSCTGVRGISYTRDRRREADVNLTPVCRPETGGAHKIVCQNNKALSGMVVRIENRTGYIKSSSLYCSDVGDVEGICRAHDKRNALFICDASGALYPLKCSWEKMVGYGKKSSLSQTESREFTFYSEYGFEMGAAGYGLSANFKATLGQSNTTGYSWTNTQESTWNVENRISVEAEAPAGCVTTVYEIVGECSFIAVRPAHFQRNDTCSGVSVLTNVYIPGDFDKGKVFFSPVPEMVEELLATRNGKAYVPRNVDFVPVEDNMGEGGVRGMDVKESFPSV